MSCLIHAFFRNAAATPEKLFIADITAPITYGEAAEKVRKIALVLLNKNIKRGDYIAVEATPTKEFLLFILAANLTGAVFVPIEPTAAPPLPVVAVFTRADQAAIYETTLSLCESETVAISNLLSFITEEAVSEILFTTGTTGAPKGVILTHGNNLAIAENIVTATKMTADNVELIPLPFYHSHALRTFYAAVLNGSSVLVTDFIHILTIFELANRYEITALDLVPSMLTVLLKSARDELVALNLDYIEIGAGFLAENLKTELKELLPKTRLYNFYGTTEAGRTAILNFQTDDKPLSIGTATANADFCVKDEALYIRGKMLFAGYYGKEKLPKGEYFLTGDAASYDADGYIFLHGRLDDLINIGGVKISPLTIEEAALKFPGVVKACAIGVPDPKYIESPKLVIVVDGNFSALAKLKAFLKEELQYPPKEIIIADDIPTTFNGKVDRKAIKKLLLG